ncbi:MAG: histidine kinase N-terminal 7TM domain-containing protein [Candidatus Promineifilaceae bacterium]
MAISWLSLVLISAAIVSGLSAVSAAGRNYIPGNKSYVAFMVGVVVWLSGYTLEIASLSFENKLFWAKFQYLGIPFITPVFVLFLAQYVSSRWLRYRWLVALMFIVPMSTATFIWVQTDLIWAKISEPIEAGGISVLRFEYGPWFYLNVLYSYLFLLIGLGVLANIAIRSPRLVPWQSRLLVIGVAVPFLTNIGYVSGLIPLSGLDLTPLSLATLGLAAAITLFEVRLLDIMPAVYRAALESVPEGVVMLDKNGRFKTLNPEAERYFGRTTASLFDRKQESVFPQEWCQQLDAAELTEKVNIDLEQAGDDDLSTYVDLRAVPVYDRRNRYVGRMVLFRDITVRKRALQALTQREAELARRVAERTAELEATNTELVRVARLKDEFLASMSHELRTPLNAVIGTAEAMSEQVYGSITPAQQKSLTRIEDSAYHLLELINDVLDVSKVAAGALDLDLQPTSVLDLCNASLNLVRTIATKKQLDCTTDYQFEKGIIHVDERRLRQILTNLLANAVKFTKIGGAFGLKVVDDPVLGHTRFVVWDTGIGIAEEDHARLFKPFVQLDASLARRHEGTGLGLALSRQLAELHGGDIELVSRLGVGSRFTVTIPWSQRDKDMMPRRLTEVLS